MQSVQSLAKSLESEEEERASVQREAFKEEVQSKKGNKLKNGGSPSLMIVKQIQDLIVNTVRHNLGEVRAKLTITPSLIPR